MGLYSTVLASLGFSNCHLSLPLFPIHIHGKSCHFPLFPAVPLLLLLLRLLWSSAMVCVIYGAVLLSLWGCSFPTLKDQFSRYFCVGVFPSPLGHVLHILLIYPASFMVLD
ncbi:hypothetical protein Bca101_057995 [Brassica carinata]